MKFQLFFWLFLVSSHCLAADEHHYENAFLYSHEKTGVAISALSAGLAPFMYQNAMRQMTPIQIAANETGILMGLRNRRIDYINADPYGVSGRQRISETIGEMGARAFAKKAGYTPLYQGAPGKGRGFDQVYQFGKQVVVVEAKGGSSALKVYRGYLQGTPKYTVKVAQEILASKTASIQAKRAAKAVIEAYRKGDLVVQAAHTSHVYGKPGLTTVQTTYGKIENPSLMELAHRSSLKLGMASGLLGGAFELASQLATEQTVNWEQVASTTLIAGVSGYAANMTNMLVQNALMNNQSRLASVLATPTTSSFLGSISSGVVASAVFAYGSYFLGYADLTTANRTLTTSLVGTTAAALTSTATLTLVATLGTASTGTAISGLSGAAATNATLAWLGGGSIAAGGGGIATGAAVLTAGVAAVAIAATAGVVYLYTLADENTERERVNHLVTSVHRQLLSTL